MTYPRVSRVNEEFKKIISHIMRHELKDPRISKMASVISVEVTRDFSYATVYVSVLGSEEERQQTMEGLTQSAGYVRREIGKQVKLHHTPAILFKQDNSIEYGVSMAQKIAELSSEESPQPETELEDEQDEENEPDDEA